MSHTQVLRRLPAFLGVTILSESVSRDAFDRLWRLAHHPDEDVRRQAEGVLKSSIGYHKYKDVEFNERILSYVEELALDPTAYTAEFTPFDLIDTLLDREMDDHEWAGMSFRVGALPVNPEYFRPVRERALVVISRALSSENSRVAVRAARSLGKAISEFRPRMRNGPTDEERAWQDDERLKALNLLQARLESSEVSLPQTWRFHKILRSAEDSAGQSEKVKEEARCSMSYAPKSGRIALRMG
jgi:Sec-independent protein translocase protein TatA